MNVADDEVSHLLVVVQITLGKIVEKQLVQRFGIGFLRRDHLAGVVRPLHLYDDANRVAGASAVMDNQVGAAAGIDLVSLLVPGVFEEISDDVFEVLFRFARL